LILHRAFFREVLQNIGAVAVLILFIFLVVRITDYLQLASKGLIPMNSVLTLLFLRLLSHLDVILPLAVYVAILLVLGRWSRDREIVVAAAAGLGVTSFLKPVLYLFAVFGILISSFSLYVSPSALQNGDNLEHEFRANGDVTGIVPGVFTEDPGGDGVYFVESYDSEKKLYRDIFIWLRSADKEGIVVASTGERTITHESERSQFLLYDGVRYDGAPGESRFQSIEFKTYGLYINDRSIIQQRIRLAGRKTSWLWRHYRNDLDIRSELSWRLSKIIMLPVLMLLALALGYDVQSRNRVLMMVGALLAYFAYANLGGYLVALSRRGYDEPLAFLWILHISIASFAMYLLFRRVKNRRFLWT
jgi:lipopolysaccharide export system permease protein